MMRVASTVPSGDTLCVTAGDARRANPWRSGEGEKKETSQPAPTVPRGDTPCVTAGDAQRANPWRELHSSLRHRRCRTTPTFAHVILSLRLPCNASNKNPQYLLRGIAERKIESICSVVNHNNLKLTKQQYS